MATSSLNFNSGIHQLPSSCYPPSDSDDEDSFVVLSNSLGPDVVKDSVLHTEPISTTIVETSLDSVSEVLARVNLAASPNVSLQENTIVDGATQAFASTEFSPEEIQKKVDELIEENTRLKDTLAQNNMAMKKQVETLSQWQQDVQRVQESHKEKFADMKKYISILKAENVLLKNATSLTESKAVVVEEPKQTTGEPTSKKTRMEYELEASKKRIEELEKAVDQLSLEKEGLLIEFTKKPCPSSVLNELDELKAANKKLLADVEAKEAEKVAFEKEYLTLHVRELSMREEADSLKQSFVEVNKQHTELQIEKKKADEMVLKLKQENEGLSTINRELAEKLDVMKTEYESNQHKLAEEISVLRNASKESSNFQETLNNIRQQLMASQMHITELKQQNTKALAEKEAEIKELQGQVKKSLISEDELTALRAQVDLYKNDFEIERHSKDEILSEKNKFADDLNHLQRRNEQLLEEIEQLRSGFVCVEKEEAIPTSSAPKRRFGCPRCQFKFSNYQALENHVYRCIELDKRLACPRCQFKFSNYQALENHVYRCIELDNLP